MAKRFCVVALIGFLALLAGCGEPPPDAASLAGARKLIKDGDVARALSQLAELSDAEPENAEVRLLMAQTLAKCDPELKIPGLQSVGKSNVERAAYQLQILAKLGDAGNAALCSVITGDDEQLALTAVEAAGQVRLKEAVAAIRAFLKQGKGPAGAEVKAVRALIRIGGRPALDAIKSYVDDATGGHYPRGLGITCMKSLNREDRLELVRETKNPAILGGIVDSFRPVPTEGDRIRARQRAQRTARLRRGGTPRPPPPVHHALEAVVAIAERGDASDDSRLRALKALKRYDERTFKSVTEKLAKGTPDDVRIEAVCRLPYVKPAEPIEPIVASFMNREEVTSQEIGPLRHALGNLVSRSRQFPKLADKYAALLERLVKAKSARVRLFAAKRLAGVAPERAIGPLIAEYDHGNAQPRQLNSFHHLVRMQPDPLYTQKDHLGWYHRQDARNTLTATLGKLKNEKYKDNPECIAALEAATKHSDKVINWPATQTLYYLAPERAFEPLVAALKDRGHGLYQIARLKTPKAVKLLFEILEAECDPNTSEKWQVSRNDVIRALIRSTASANDLIRAIHLTEKPGRGHGFKIIWKQMVESRPKKDLEEVIVSLLAGKHTRLRREAARRLYTLPIETRMKLAAELINDSDAQVRSSMLYIILEGNRLGLVKPDVFIQMLSSNDGNIAGEVAKVIGKNPVEAAREPMVKLLYDTGRSRNAMYALVAFFKKIPDKRAAPIFEREIVSGSPRATVKMLVDVLKLCSDDLPKSAKTVARSLRSRSAWVRDRTIKALELLSQKAVVPDIVAALKHGPSVADRDRLNRLLRRLGWTPPPPKPESGAAPAEK